MIEMKRVKKRLKKNYDDIICLIIMIFFTDALPSAFKPHDMGHYGLVSFSASLSLSMLLSISLSLCPLSLHFNTPLLCLGQALWRILWKLLFNDQR